MGFLFFDDAPFDNVWGITVHQPVHETAGADQPDLRQVHRQKRPPFPIVESTVFKQAVEGFGLLELFGQFGDIELIAFELFHRLSRRRNDIGAFRKLIQLRYVLRGEQVGEQAFCHSEGFPAGNFGSEEHHLAELPELLPHKAMYPQIIEVFAQHPADVGRRPIIGDDVDEQAAILQQPQPVGKKALF